MQLLDLIVPLDWNIPVSPCRTPFSLKRIRRIATGDSSNLSVLPPRLRGGPTVRGGTPVVESCMLLRVAGADGATARVVLRRS